MSVLDRVNAVVARVTGANRLRDMWTYQAERALLELAERHSADPRNLLRSGYRMYSQNEEDGLIAEIFRRIGLTNRRFVEFGIGNGLENNTFALLFSGWSGLWIDASKEHVGMVRRGLPRTIESRRLSLIHAYVTRGNINELIGSLFEGEIDLLSVDIDGNDAHVLDAINCVQPRVIVCEYNAKFMPPISYCMSYDEAHMWNGDDNFGASLTYFSELLGSKGYSLVCCNLTGSNAFFVRNDLIGDAFERPGDVSFHFQPPRYYLGGTPAGHPAAYSTLERALRR